MITMDITAVTTTTTKLLLLLLLNCYYLNAITLVPLLSLLLPLLSHITTATHAAVALVLQLLLL